MIYEFKCNICNIIREVTAKASEYDNIKDKILCECCGEKMERVFSQLNFQLKGYGWSMHGYGSSSEYEKAKNSDDPAAFHKFAEKEVDNIVKRERLQPETPPDLKLRRDMGDKSIKI